MSFDGSADWLSYSLQDFMMFGPQVFLRLFVRINQDLWPWPLVAVAVALMIPFLLVHRQPPIRRLGLVLLSCAWVATGLGFLVSYFGPINWPAIWFGWAFVAQGVLVAIVALWPRAYCAVRPPLAVAGLWLVAVTCLPWLTVLLSGEWRAAALFGLTPGTTVAAGAVATAMMTGIWRWVALVVPMLWVVFSAVTFWGLQLSELLVFPATALILAVVAVWLSPSPVQSRG